MTDAAPEREAIAKFAELAIKSLLLLARLKLRAAAPRNPSTFPSSAGRSQRHDGRRRCSAPC